MIRHINELSNLGMIISSLLDSKTTFPEKQLVKRLKTMDIYLRSGQFNLLSMSVSAYGGDG